MLTTLNSRTKNTLFSLTFGHKTVIPTEIGPKTLRVSHYFKEANEQTLRKDLDLIEERRAEASIKAAVRKQHVANYYNKIVKPRSFQVCDLV